jgi:integrase
MAQGSIRKHVREAGIRYEVVVDLGPGPDGQRRQRSKSFKTKKEAQAHLAAWRVEIDKGAAVDRSQQTVAQMMEYWLQTHVRPRLRPKTVYDYEQTITKHIVPALGPIPVQKLGPDVLQQFYSDKLAAGCGVRTIRLCHLHLSQALKQAVRLGLVARNVADLVTQPQERPREMQTWSAEEAQAFLAVADRSDHGPLWLLALTTGLRRGELLGLRWKDVDLERGVLHVRQTVIALRRHAGFSQPKTPRSRRSAALLDPVTLALREHKRRQNAQRPALGATWRDHDLVFCTGLGTPINPDNLKRDYDRLVALACPTSASTMCATPSPRTPWQVAPTSRPSARPSATPTSASRCALTPTCCPSSAARWPPRSAPPSSPRRSRTSREMRSTRL